MISSSVEIAVVDHGAGNLVSITQALERAGASATLASGPEGLEAARGVVLPGVGATGAVMDGIEEGGFTAALTELDVPLLGICVGMQVLFEGSDEDDAPGLGLLPGRVRRLRDAPTLPHIGWNDLTLVRPDPLFAACGPSPLVYFVHSYAPVPDDPALVVATARHGGELCAAVRSGDVAGVQFHPERSGDIGLAVLANFVTACAARDTARAS